MINQLVISQARWLLALAALDLTCNSPAFAGLYSVKDLGVLANLPGKNNSGANAINNNGKLALSNVTNGNYQAFTYSLYDDTWTNLGTLGGPQSFALGINDPGQVVGGSLTNNSVNHACLWTSGGSGGVAGNPQMQDLGTLAGGTNSEAAGINCAGQIAGYSEVIQNAQSYDHAFLYTGGTMVDIGKLLGQALPYSYSEGINDNGHIAGIAYDPSFATAHAFYYDGSTASDLGNFGASANALAINNNDNIVGYSTMTNYYTHAFEYSGGVMHDLGTLGGDYSYALGINNSNVVVGGSYVDASNTIYHAFIVAGNSMADLNNQLNASGSNWVLNEAVAINDSGQIVGRGELDGTNHAFLLNPVPQIASVEDGGTNVQLSFKTINAAPYAVEYEDNLSDSNWSDLNTNIIGDGGFENVTNFGASALPQRFYRVLLSVP